MSPIVFAFTSKRPCRSRHPETCQYHVPKHQIMQLEAAEIRKDFEQDFIAHMYANLTK